MRTVTTVGIDDNGNTHCAVGIGFHLQMDIHRIIFGCRVFVEQLTVFVGKPVFQIEQIGVDYAFGFDLSSTEKCEVFVEKWLLLRPVVWPAAL